MGTTLTLGPAPAPPTIFVSSTYFDLRAIRQELEQHLSSLGYRPVLFESAGAIPNVPAALSALRHASQADICVLIVGSRYGTADSETNLSWTHREFLTARDLGRPVFAFVDRDTLVKYELYRDRRDPSFWTQAEVRLFSMLEEVSEIGSRFPFESLPQLKAILQQQLVSYFGYLVRSYASFDLMAPTSAGGWNSLGVAENRRGNFGRALYCYRKALELDPQRRDARGNVVKSLRSLGRLEDAEREAQLGIQLHPDHPRLRTLLIWVLIAAERFDAAVAESRRLTKDFPNDDRVWATMAKVYRRLNRREEALEAQRRAVEIMPTDPKRVRFLRELEGPVVPYDVGEDSSEDEQYGS